MQLLAHAFLKRYVSIHLIVVQLAITFFPTIPNVAQMSFLIKVVLWDFAENVGRDLHQYTSSAKCSRRIIEYIKRQFNPPFTALLWGFRQKNAVEKANKKRLLTQLNSSILIHSDLAPHQSEGVWELQRERGADMLTVSNMLALRYRWYGNCFCERCLEVFWQQRKMSLATDSTGPATGT